MYSLDETTDAGYNPINSFSLFEPCVARLKLHPFIFSNERISGTGSGDQMAAVSASDIAPDAFSDTLSQYVEAADLQYDLKNLVVFNPHSIQESLLKVSNAEKEKFLICRAQKDLDYLFSKLLSHPTESTKDGPVVVLPAEEKTILPREKPLPTPRPPTKWELFAKEKGIKKKKRTEKIWDEKHQEWRRPYGYKRANDGILDEGIIEVNERDAMKDPWSDARDEKLKRVEKNLKNQMRNKMRAGGLNPSAGIPVDMIADADKKKRKRGRENTRQALNLVQGSTASMGKFDEFRQNEPERKKVSNRRTYRSSTIGVDEEKKISMKILNSVLINDKKKKNSEDTARQSKENLAVYDAIEGVDSSMMYKRKKGKGAAGKVKKITKKRAK